MQYHIHNAIEQKRQGKFYFRCLFIKNVTYGVMCIHNQTLRKDCAKNQIMQ